MRAAGTVGVVRFALGRALVNRKTVVFVANLYLFGGQLYGVILFWYTATIVVLISFLYLHVIVHVSLVAMS